MQSGFSCVTTSNQGLEKSWGGGIGGLRLKLEGMDGFGMGFPASLGWVKGIVMDQTGEVPGETLGMDWSRGHCLV